MLKLTADDLMREVRDARRVRSLHLDMWNAVLTRYIGRHWRSGIEHAPTPENYPFAYIAFVLPQLIDRAPGIDVTAAFDVADDPVAKGLQIAAERIMEEIGWCGVSKAVAVDALMAYGCTKLTLDSRGDYDGEGLAAVGGRFQQMPLMPARTRISPRRLLLDAQGVSAPPEGCRLVGDEYKRDLEDVRRDERYDPELVQQLVDDADRLAREDTDPLHNGSDKTESERKQIWLVDLYIPEHRRIITLAESGPEAPATILRNEPYRGPDEGPYTLWGCYLVPDQVYPISPLIAMWEQFLELQDHSTEAALEASRHKRIGVFSPGAKEDAERIRKAASGDMVPVKDPGGVSDFEIGGTSPARIEYVQVLRDRLDRNLGFSDAQRGLANSATATSNQLAQSNSDLRVGGLRSAIEQMEAADLKKLLWYLVYESAIRFQLVVDDQDKQERFTATFQGGPWQGGYIRNQWIPPQREMDAVDFSLRVRPGSMAKKDDALAQKRAQDELALAGQLAQPLAAYGMAINWMRLLDRYGDAFGVANYSKIILLDPQMGMMGSPMPMQFGPQVPGVSQQGMQGQQMGMGGMRPGMPSMGRQPGMGLAGPQMVGLMGQAQRVA